MSAELTIIPPQELMRQATDIAGMTKDIVVASAIQIGKKKHLPIEAWQTIAIAHNCFTWGGDPRRVTVDGVEGFEADGFCRLPSGEVILSKGAGFVGDDEPDWKSRAVYARRAMAQTRAASRISRAFFAHVVGLMNAGLSTTPLEEVPMGGFDNNAINEREAHREQSARNVATGEHDTRDASAQHRQQEPDISEKATIRDLTVLDVNVAEGKTKAGKPYKKFGVKLSNGVTAGTFSETIGQAAINALAKGWQVTVIVQPGSKQGYTDLVELAAQEAA